MLIDSEERLVQVTINISLDFPNDVSDRELEFYLNEGSWCWDNLIGILQEHSNKYGCICDICEGKVLGEMKGGEE